MNIYTVAKKALSGLAKLVFNIHVHGSENEPAEGGYIAVANHISFLDVFVTAVAVKRQIRFMAKKELFNNKFLNWVLRGIGMVPVDRGASDIQAMRTCMEVLKEGRLLGIFPQGHRYKEDDHRELQNGAAMMALRARPVVVPVHVSAPAKLFRKVTIRVGDPVDLSDIVRVNAPGLAEANKRIAGGIWQEDK